MTGHFITSPRLVIFDSFEVPCVERIALIGRQIEPGLHEWRYVAALDRFHPGKVVSQRGRIDAAVPVSDFGIQLELNERENGGWWLEALTVSESRVRDDFGQVRHWQILPNGSEAVRIKTSLVAYLLLLAARAAANDTHKFSERTAA